MLESINQPFVTSALAVNQCYITSGWFQKTIRICQSKLPIRFTAKNNLYTTGWLWSWRNNGRNNRRKLWKNYIGSCIKTSHTTTTPNLVYYLKRKWDSAYGTYITGKENRLWRILQIHRRSWRRWTVHPNRCEHLLSTPICRQLFEGSISTKQIKL
jgi:hypothetical protein